MITRFLFALLYLSSFTIAQNISGLWVAERLDAMNPNDFYAIMYLKVDDAGNIVGYTYDEEAGGWCNYKLEGKYKSEKEYLKIANTDLIEKTENHKGSLYKLNYKIKDNQEYLEGSLKLKGSGGVLGAITSVAIGVGVGIVTGGRVIIATNLGRVTPKRYVIYQRPKVKDLSLIEDYDKLKPYIDLLEDNTEDIKQEEPKEIVVEDQPIEEEPQPEDEAIPEEIVAKDEPTEGTIVEVEQTDQTIALSKHKENRRYNLLKSHSISSRKIKLEILDKNLEDGDRISIYANGKLIKFNIEVTKAPKVIEFILPANQKVSKILFVANNVGRVPPNTATIRYTIDEITYEEAVSTDNKENKYLQFVLED